MPPTYAQEVFLPADEAYLQPDFFSFRAVLFDIIARHDTQALLTIVHPDVWVSFGGDNGIEEFKQTWLSDNGREDIWEILTEVLARGGSFHEDGSFSAPYVYSRWPDHLDAFEYVAIVGTDVPIMASDDDNSKIIEKLSFSTVPVAGTSPFSADWVKIKLSNGQEGYARRTFARSPIDYRIIFEKIDGQWLIKALIAGD